MGNIIFDFEDVKKFPNVPPSHLFTLEEIEKVINGIDNTVKNTLVVYADGNIDIVSGHTITNHDDYAVRLEMWQPGNAPVRYKPGIKMTYLLALNGWLLFLNSRTSVWSDYIEEEDEHILLSEIRKFYK